MAGSGSIRMGSYEKASWGKNRDQDLEREQREREIGIGIMLVAVVVGGRYHDPDERYGSPFASSS